MQKILIVEHDRALSNGIALALKAESYLFLQAFDTEEARMLLRDNSVGLVILDLDLPGGSAPGFLQEIKGGSRLPAMILTAGETEQALLSALESGADDCLVKPFSLMVLRARINAQVRKAHRSVIQVYQSRDFYFSFQRQEFSKGERSIELNRTEQRLLRLLVENRGLTLSRRELISRVWTNGTPLADENALSVAVKHLRDKLEDNPGAPRYIKTVYGIGYTWADGRERHSAVTVQTSLEHSLFEA